MPPDAQHPEFLMCPADFFEIRYEINAWMEGNTGRTRLTHAREQWRALHEQISRRAAVRLMPPANGQPDLVFTANAGVVVGKKVVLGRFRYPERRPEEPLYRKWFEENGYEVLVPPPDIYFEGAGDALADRVAPRIWMGYGFRSVLEAADWIACTLGIETIPLRLVDQRFYHLDTCLLPLNDGSLMYYPAALDERSRRRIEELLPDSMRIEIDEHDALDFACNAVQIDNTLIMHRCSPALAGRLAAHGLSVIQTPLDQFILAGGAARCLCLRLDEALAQPHEKAPSELVHRIVTIEGHLFDNGILVRAMDLIAAGGGSFETRELCPGQRREDHSFVRLAVSAPNAGALEPILAQLLQLGAHIDEITEKPTRLAPVEIDGVAPDDFYCTTIHHTELLVDGQWIPAARQRMDGVIVVERGHDGPRAVVSLIRDLRKGQDVVVGVDGLRIMARSKPAGERQTEEFAFMSSAVSSERRVELAVDAVAWEMAQIHRHGGRIVLVAGPVVVHTGGIPALCELVRMGFIQAVLSGNALATHDIELALYGTSLGVDYQSGLTVHGGHRHHLRAINTIRRCGSIAAAVEQGVLKQGIMYELVKKDIPFCLAGSIRDDGPLPETMMDLVAAQNEYQRLLAGAEMVLMLSSMLHSIGVGNMTPGGVRLVCVDINPAVATKLADRGSLESRPIVTDVGLFLTMLLDKIKKMPE